MSAPPPDPRRWRVFAVLAFVQFMLVLDDTIVNVALPSIARDLQMDAAGLAWVVNAYLLAFGGLLLLGGRAADLFGRRLVFLAGVGTFSVASLVSGLAQDDVVLIAGRALQGVGAAMAAPAALSLVALTFTDGKERARAFGIWGAVAGVAGTLGVILSGVITDAVSWRWVFFINLPVGALALLLVPRLVRESRKPTRQTFDVAGAVLVTGAITLLVYSLLESERRGAASVATLGGYAGAALLLAAFVAVESRIRFPLVRLQLFRQRRLSVAAVLQLLNSMAFLGMLYLLTLYMQQVLGYSALRTGVAYLAFPVGILLAVVAGSALIPRIGVRPVLAVGLLIEAAGMLWLARIPVDGGYWVDLLPAMFAVAVGGGLVMPTINITALHDVPENETGVASGTLNAGQQVGGAIGLAVLVAVAVDRTADQLAAGAGSAAAQVSGTRIAFLVSAALLVLGAAVAAVAVGDIRPQSAMDTHLPLDLDDELGASASRGA